jgi:hypothetical protein
MSIPISRWRPIISWMADRVRVSKAGWSPRRRASMISA